MATSAAFTVSVVLDAGRAERFGRKAHEPLIELVNGSRDVGLPEMRSIRVNAFDHPPVINTIPSAVLCSASRGEIRRAPAHGFAEKTAWNPSTHSPSQGSQGRADYVRGHKVTALWRAG